MEYFVPVEWAVEKSEYRLRSENSEVDSHYRVFETSISEIQFRPRTVKANK